MAQRIKKIGLLCLVVVLTGQVYWNFFLEGFRVSASIILLPVLLLTLLREEKPRWVGLWLAGAVFLFRAGVELLSGAPLWEAAKAQLPGTVFYLCYCALFDFFMSDADRTTSPSFVPVLFLCDFAGNLAESAVKTGFRFAGLDIRFFVGLAAVAVTRAILAFAILAAERRYRSLLTKAQHEARYQRLYLMKTGLRDEVYFMRKNSEETEAVMSAAYRMYEQLADAQVPEATKKLALAIARDVHEIKKDYYRIIQGLEQELDDAGGEESTSLADILQILSQSTQRVLLKKSAPIHLEFHCETQLVTRSHYAVMSVLKNLVNNACEAVEATGHGGTIRLTAKKEAGDYLFVVEDNGCGIRLRDLPRIFQMGFSTKFDEKTGSIYRGVGLAGVKMTVEEQLHGTIQVESEQGRGTRFSVRLPAAGLEEEP